MKTSQRMSVFVTLSITFLVQTLYPLTQVLAVTDISPNVKNQVIPPVISSPFVAPTSSNWSAVDWDAPVVLPKDLESYQKELTQKISEKKFIEAKNLSVKKQNLVDKKTLESFAVPDSIKQTILSLSKDGHVLVNQKEALKQKLKFFEGTSSSVSITSSTPEQPIILDKKSPFRPSRLVPITKLQSSLETITKTKTFSAPANVVPFFHRTEASLNIRPVTPFPKQKNVSFKDMFLSLFASPVHATDFTPIYSYDPEASHSSVEEALNFIQQQQNFDGSFTSSSNALFLTGETIEALTELYLVNNTQISSALAFVQNIPVTNSWEQSMKNNFVHDVAGTWAALMRTHNADGGFGVVPGYQSDFFTTLEVMRTFKNISPEYNYQNDIQAPLQFLLSKIEPNGAVYLTKNANPSYYAINKLIRVLTPFQNISYQDAQGVRHTVQEKITLMLNFLASEYSLDTHHFSASDKAIDSAMTASNFSVFQVHPQIQKDLLENLQKRQSSNGSFENDYLTTLESIRALAAPDIEVTQIVPSANLRNGNPITLTVTLRNKGYRPSGNMKLNLFFDNLFVGTIENLQNSIHLLPGETADVRFTQNNTANVSGNIRITTFIDAVGDNTLINNWSEVQTNVAARADGQPTLPLYYIAQSQSGHRFAGVNVRWALKPDPTRRGFLVMYKQVGAAEWNYGPLDTNMGGGFFTGAEFGEGQQFEVTVGVLGPGDVVTYFADTTRVFVTNQNNNLRGTLSGTLTDGANPITSSSVFAYAGAANQITNESGQFQFTNIPNGTNAISLTGDASRESFVTLVQLPPNGNVQNIRVFTKLKSDGIAPVINRVEPQIYNIPRSGRVIDFIASGTDNIGIARAHLYAYIPSSQTWLYIGAGAPSPNQGDVTISWYIPELESGPGYKVKAVMQDFHGNISAERESLPFEIISGVPPQFTITSPNGNESWQLGVTSTIRWTNRPSNTVPTVNLEALYANQSEIIASGIPNTGSYDWKIPPSSYVAGNSIRVRLTGQDSRTQMTGEDTSDQTFRIVNSSTLPQSPWNQAEALTSSRFENIPNLEVSNARAVYTSDGTKHVVYRTVTDVIGNPRVITEQLLYTNKTTTSTWSDPVVVYNRQTQTDLSLTGYSWIEDFNIEALPQNKLALTYNTAFPDGCAGQNQKEIFFMQTNERGEWSVPQNISSNQTASFQPHVAIESNGKIHFSWTDGQSFDAQCTPTGNKIMKYKTFSNGQWSVLENIAVIHSPAFADIAVTTNGIPYILYKDMDDASTKYSKKQNNVWSAPVILTQNSFEGEMVSGVNNTLYYVTRQNYQDPNLNRLRPRIVLFIFNGVAWSQPQDVFSSFTTSTMENPSITLDSLGRPHIATEFVDPQTIQRKVLWTLKNNNAFLPVQSVRQDYDSLVPASTRLVANASGEIFFLSKSMFSLREHLFVSTANVLAFPPAPAPVQVPTSTPVTNLFTDGNMEAPTSSRWSGYTVVSSRKVTSTFFGGRQSMFVDTTGRTGGIQQLNLAVTTGTQYTFSFWYKLNRGTLTPLLNINGFVADFENQVSQLTTTGSWQFYSRTFTVPRNYIQNFRPRLSIQNGQGYFDDVLLTPTNPLPAAQVAPPAPTSTVLIDGDMETVGVNSWSSLGVLSRKEKTAVTFHSGAKGLFVSNSPQQANLMSGVQQGIQLLPNQRYHLQFWYRIDQGTLYPSFRNGLGSLDFIAGFRIPALGPTNSEWRVYDRIFTTPAVSANSLKLLFRFSGPFQAYFDDVILEQL